MALVTRRSSQLATTLILLVVAISFFLSMEVSSLKFQPYGGWKPAGLNASELQNSDYKDMAVFAVAEENKKTSSKAEQLKLVSLDKGFWADLHSEEEYFRVDITASSARHGKAKYSAVVVNGLSGILVLDEFERSS